MRIIHVCLAALLMTGAVSCQEQSAAESKDAQATVAAAKPMPALPSSPGAARPGKPLKPVKFGISTANASSHSYTIAPGKPLEIKGWYVADEAVNVTYDLNGESSKAHLETRGDVKKNHPDYKIAQGWIVKVPAQKLKPKNKFDIHIGSTNWPMTITVK